mgnify:CR=1 FL=1
MVPRSGRRTNGVHQPGEASANMGTAHKPRCCRLVQVGAATGSASVSRAEPTPKNYLDGSGGADNRLHFSRGYAVPNQRALRNSVTAGEAPVKQPLAGYFRCVLLAESEDAERLLIEHLFSVPVGCGFVSPGLPLPLRSERRRGVARLASVRSRRRPFNLGPPNRPLGHRHAKRVMLRYCHLARPFPFHDVHGLLRLCPRMAGS